MPDPSASGEDGMALNAAEQRALMLHRVASHIDGVDRWLDWGDLPMLGEFTFERLADAVQEFANDLYRQAAEVVDDLPGLLTRATDIDSHPCPGHQWKASRCVRCGASYFDRTEPTDG